MAVHMNNIFDSRFNGIAHSDMYREWALPGMFPKERQPVLSNWSDDDLAMYCGGAYAKEAYSK